MTDINTHDMTIDFGKHKGERVTRIPRSYLHWLANGNVNESWANIAKSELKRRGSSIPTMELSGHALDRASQSCLEIWKKTRKEEPTQQPEGLYTWLMRMATEARKNPPVREGVFRHGDMQFIFEEGDEFPSLKTVMPKAAKEPNPEIPQE